MTPDISVQPRPPWTQLLSGRLTQLCWLAAIVLVYSVLGIAIGNSLFVSYVGASHLPRAFVLIGLCSMPAYIIFSQVVDRYRRPQLFRAMLLGAIFIALGLRILLVYNVPYVYYGVLIVSFFQWDLHNNVLFPSLLTDYLTTLEYKRHAPLIGLAQAGGMLLGGGLTAVLSRYFSTQDLLLCLPVFYAIGIAQLTYLDNSQRQLTVAKSEAPAVSILDSLLTFPDVVKRYPLALFLASSSFLLVIVYMGSEFLWFNIYGDYFTNQELTGFLGLMRILISGIQMVVIYGFTRPCLKSLGVAQMNVVYPLTTLVSLAGLLSNVGLSAAIGLHVNGDALYKAINMPVHQLNYNAIPREFIGRIRALSDGFIYAIGLTLAGGLLWICESRLSLMQIAGLVAGLAGLLLLVRLPMGRFYTRGLEAMIRSNSINLDEFESATLLVSPESIEAVRELLQNSDRYTQIKGLELAAKMDQPAAFLEDVEALILGAETQVYGKAIALFTDCPDLLAHFQQSLKTAETSTLRTFALEVLLINQSVPEQAHLDSWQGSPEPALQVLGAIGQIMADPTATPPWPTKLDSATARMITRIVAYGRNPALTPLIGDVVLAQTNPEAIRAGLEVLLTLAQRGDERTAGLAAAKLDHPDAGVRLAAFDLLRVTRCPEHLDAISEGLADADPRVRQGAAKALAAYGRAGLAIAKAQLAAPPAAAGERANSAITAIGLVRTKSASNLLFDYLSPSYKALSQTRKWQQQIPTNDPRWQPLRVAIADYQARLVQKVLEVLSALGYSRTVNAVNRLLTMPDRSELENALEVLASVNHRRFVLPLLPLLEAPNPTEATGKPVQATPLWLRKKGYRLLLEALESKDRWIKVGALIALATVPVALVNDPDPVVKQVATQIFGSLDDSTLPGKTAMNRLLLLKNVALFKNLSLDELLLIDKSLEQTQVLAEEVIFNEGDWGTHLYIIATGTVRLVKTIDGTQREIRQLQVGQYFGEVALFDDATRWDGAIAGSDCTLLKLAKNRFLSLITQRPHIILEICRFLSQRLRETDKHRSDGSPANHELVDGPRANEFSHLPTIPVSLETTESPDSEVLPT